MGDHVAGWDDAGLCSVASVSEIAVTFKILVPGLGNGDLTHEETKQVIAVEESDRPGFRSEGRLTSVQVGDCGTTANCSAIQQHRRRDPCFEPQNPVTRVAELLTRTI
jgi:hypothetical protein